MADPIHLDVRAGYDRWAEVYDSEGNPLVALEEPLVREWIAPRPGLRVVDVGCGTGRHALWLAEAGAGVDAYDASEGMIARARAKLGQLGVTLSRHLLPDALPAADDSYDVALFALVADHVSDLACAFGELRRVTKPDGYIVFTVLHPAMNLKGVTARFRDPADGREVRVAAHEHTYGDYVTAILSAGLTIERIVERKADAALAAEVPRAEKYIGWPLLLAMRLRVTTG